MSTVFAAKMEAEERRRRETRDRRGGQEPVSDDLLQRHLARTADDYSDLHRDAIADNTAAVVADGEKVAARYRNTYPNSTEMTLALETFLDRLRAGKHLLKEGSDGE